MKSFTLQPRLYIYNTTIGNYDIIDKYKFSKIKFSKIKKIHMYSSINKLTNKNLNLPLFKEFITKQSLNFYQVLKISYLKKFIITLRGYLVYLYLEILINSFFLSNELQKTFCKNNQYVNIFLSFTFNYFFTNYLSEKFISQKDRLNFYLQIKFQRQEISIETFVFYYFIC